MCAAGDLSPSAFLPVGHATCVAIQDSDMLSLPDAKVLAADDMFFFTIEGAICAGECHM